MPSQRRRMDLHFPAAGVVRRFGFDRVSSSRGKYPTPWAVNVRPTDPFNKRLRGGSRPGLSSYTGEVPAFPATDLHSEDSFALETEQGDTLVTHEATTEALNAGTMEAVSAFGIASLTDAVSASTGTAPTGYTIGCMYRDRLVLSGADNVVYMSRQGDYTDWDYGADLEDAGRAFLLQASEAGAIGDTVTALVPFHDSSLLIATATSLWVLKGDPAADGSLQEISDDVGIVSNTAWCEVGDKIAFLSADGLYQVGGNGSGLEDLSGERLPEELFDVDTDTVTVLMEHSHVEDGFYLFLVGGDYHYFFDLKFEGFWPFVLSVNPTSAFAVDGKTVIGDGTSYYTFSGTTDNGSSIQSHLLVGPIRPGTAGEMGMLSAIHGAVELTGSNTVTWNVIEGTSAEDAAENAKAAIELYRAGSTSEAAAYVSASGIWYNSRNRVAMPRVRSMWLVLWLHTTATWAYETIVADIKPFGVWRY